MNVLRLIPALVAALILFGCSDDSPTDSSGDNNNNNNSGTFTNKASGTVNGNEWTAVNFLATRNAISSIVAVTFSAFGNAETNVNFGITNASVGSFAVAEGSANQADFHIDGKDYGKDETGTVKIDAISEKGMRGSFNFTAKTSTGETGTATGTFEATF